MNRTALRIWVLASALFAGASAVAAPPPEPTRSQVEQLFSTWLTDTVWPAARATGVSRPSFDKALAAVTIDWTLPELVLPGQAPDLRTPELQAEFRSPAAYFNERNLASVVAGGRAQMKRWDKTLTAIEAQYGVPKTLLLAFWGRESSFGEEKLANTAIEALATESFLGKRKEIFFPELVAALQIVERGEAEPAAMRSSWAGALGQPQLLPSDFLRNGVDFDGDGRRDIWKSPPDALATMASFIRSKGWRAGIGWGVEASVPASVACSLEGQNHGRTAAEWARLGVRTVGGDPLPALGSADPRYLLMPAGRGGPAFIVSDNYYRLKEYNNSDLYALFVAEVADRIQGGSPFKTPWTVPTGFTRAAILKMQQALVAAGKDVGNLDGLVGGLTRVAIGEWQLAHGMPATCFVDTALLAKFD